MKNKNKNKEINKKKYSINVIINMKRSEDIVFFVSVYI